MRIEEFQSMSSEIVTLEELLEEIPEEDVIDRRSILARLEQAKARLPKLQEVDINGANLNLMPPSVLDEL